MYKKPSKPIKYQDKGKEQDKSHNYIGYIPNKPAVEPNKQSKSRLSLVLNKLTQDKTTKKQQPLKLIPNKIQQPLQQSLKKLAQNHRISTLYDSDLNLTDNQQNIKSSYKKQLEDIQISVPAKYKPQKVIQNMKNSIIAALKMKKQIISIEEIFQLPIMEEIIGPRAPQKSKPLKLISMNERNIPHLSDPDRPTTPLDPKSSANLQPPIIDSEYNDHQVVNQGQLPQIPNFEEGNEKYPKDHHYHQKYLQNFRNDNRSQEHKYGYDGLYNQMTMYQNNVNFQKQDYNSSGSQNSQKNQQKYEFQQLFETNHFQPYPRNKYQDNRNYDNNNNYRPQVFYPNGKFIPHIQMQEPHYQNYQRQNAHMMKFMGEDPMILHQNFMNPHYQAHFNAINQHQRRRQPTEFEKFLQNGF